MKTFFVSFCEKVEKIGNQPMLHRLCISYTGRWRCFEKVQNLPGEAKNLSRYSIVNQAIQTDSM